MKLPLILTVLSAVCCFSQESPKTMTKIETVLEGPEIPAGSFATKPKVMYRAGSRYCRVEEAEDNEHGIHGLLIVNEPDAWMVNLMTETARHIVDSGPTFNCHLPIFVEDPKKDALGLEFGLEIEFFRSKGATVQQGVVLHGKQTTQYQLEIGDSKLGLFTSGTPEKPLAVGRVHGNNGEMFELFWYHGFEEVQFDPKLFAKPSGVKIEDAKQ